MKITYDVYLRLLDPSGQVAMERSIGQVTIKNNMIVNVTSGLYGSLRPGEPADIIGRKLPEPYYVIKKSQNLAKV
jgi:aspartate aminotransferase-like enzyme